MGTRLLGYLLVIVAAVIVAAVFYLNSNKSDIPIVFSPTQILNSTWLSYKTEYVETDTGRTIDKQRQNVTTSEGQSYTMLRAVWLGDKDMFDLAWKWTQTNLQHTDDHLFSWLWGENPDGTYGVLTAQGGSTTAADADQDIALALVFAYSRWQDTTYVTQARSIIEDIWEKEVINVGDVPYLSADNLEKTSTNPYAAINPSYFSPASYKIFANVDKKHPWNTLVNSSYALLKQSITSVLDKDTSANLPPDWIRINKTTGEIRALPQDNNTTNFSFDALRVPWRLMLDWQWFGDEKAKTTLALMSGLKDEWLTAQTLPAVIAHDGTVLSKDEVPAKYGGTIGYFMNESATDAKNLYETKLLYLYNPGKNTWKEVLSYYDDNWAWFGIALYNNLLPNLSQDLPPNAFN